MKNVKDNGGSTFFLLLHRLQHKCCSPQDVKIVNLVEDDTPFVHIWEKQRFRVRVRGQGKSKKERCWEDGLGAKEMEEGRKRVKRPERDGMREIEGF